MTYCAVITASAVMCVVELLCNKLVSDWEMAKHDGVPTCWLQPIQVSTATLSDYISRQESCAVARKPRDAAAVLFALKFTDNITYKFKSSQSFEIHASELQTYRRKTEFNAKWPFKVIQGHVFSSQWKGDQALNKYFIIVLASFHRVPKM